MAKAENIEKTITVGLKVGVTASVFAVGSEVLLNRTQLSEGAKAGAVAATGVLGGMALAGYTPHIAAGLIVGSVVYASQSAARATRLDARVDALFSKKVADAEAAAAPAATPAATTPAATPSTTPAATGLPRRQLDAPRATMPRVSLREAMAA